MSQSISCPVAPVKECCGCLGYGEEFPKGFEAVVGCMIACQRLQQPDMFPKVHQLVIVCVLYTSSYLSLFFLCRDEVLHMQYKGHTALLGFEQESRRQKVKKVQKLVANVSSTAITKMQQVQGLCPNHV